MAQIRFFLSSNCDCGFLITSDMLCLGSMLISSVKALSKAWTGIKRKEVLVLDDKM